MTRKFETKEVEVVTCEDCGAKHNVEDGRHNICERCGKDICASNRCTGCIRLSDGDPVVVCKPCEDEIRGFVLSKKPYKTVPSDDMGSRFRSLIEAEQDRRRSLDDGRKQPETTDEKSS